MENLQLKKVSIFDSSVLSFNLGNQIIADSIEGFIDKNLSNSYVIKLQYTERIRHKSKKYIRNSDATILAGTNSLSSNILSFEQFPINLLDLVTINNLILCGVGWFQYQKKPNFINKTLLKILLSGDYKHSVRDSFTKNMLESIGFSNVINTSCPTLWDITLDDISNIPIHKAQNAITTLTDYNKNTSLDTKFLNLICSNYDKVFFWPQGLGDYDYLLKILSETNLDVEIIEPNLSAYNAILDHENVDYIGTRLHAGIRAIQKGIRTFIIAVDNRASEISKDINIPCAQRKDYEQLLKFINKTKKTEITIPYEQIEEWKSQFKDF